MTKQQIVEKINTLMAAKAGINANDIKPEDFYDELCTDSMQCIELLMEIEDVFAVIIPSERLIYVSTMQNVYDLVEQSLNEMQEYINAIVHQTPDI